MIAVLVVQQNSLRQDYRQFASSGQLKSIIWLQIMLLSGVWPTFNEKKLNVTMMLLYQTLIKHEEGMAQR